MQVTRNTYRDDLLGNKSGDLENVAVPPAAIGVLGNTEEEGDGIENVAKDELQSQRRFVDVEVLAPPGQKTIDKTDQRDDAEKRGDNSTSDLDTEPSTVGKGVQSILGLVLVVIGDDNTASSQGLLRFGIAQLGDGQRGRDGHDA
jgi:hypothetical protein